MGNRRFTSSLALTVFTMVLATSPAYAAPVDEARAVLDRAVAAFNAGDFDAYQASLADDIEAYAGVHTPLRFVGKAEWMAFIGGLQGMSANYAQRHPQCRAYGADIVLCNGYFVFTTKGSAGATQTQSGRSSMALVRTGGGWLIVNMHFSALF